MGFRACELSPNITRLDNARQRDRDGELKFSTAHPFKAKFYHSMTEGAS
jgi:hypothetical protein